MAVSAHANNRPAAPLGAGGDGAGFRDILRRAGWADDSIRLITGSAATAGNIRAGLDWLRDRSTDSSFSVFHYSGHVYQRPGDPDRDGEALDEFIVPFDNQVIVDRELGNRLASIRGWLWSDINGCESNGFNEGGLHSDRRLFTGSSEEHQKSYEQPEWRMSVYTGLMTRAAQDGTSDTNRDGVISIQEMFRVTERDTPRITAGQRKGVQNPVIFGGGGQEWFLSGPPGPPPPPPAVPGLTNPNAGKLCILPNICI